MAKDPQIEKVNGVAFSAGDYPGVLIHSGHMVTAAGELARRVLNQPGSRGSSGPDPAVVGKLVELENEMRTLQSMAHPGRLRSGASAQTMGVDWSKIMTLIQLVMSIIADIRANHQRQ
jgi:hypothetical protein